MFFGRYVIRTILLPVVLCLATEVSFSQYYLDPDTRRREDSSSVLGIERHAFPVLFIDIRSAGMGLTSITDTLSFTATQMNPALLARGRAFGGAVTLMGSTPIETIDAIIFLSDNEGEFNTGTSAQDVYDLVKDYSGNPALAPQLGAALQELLRVPEQMVTEVVGNPDNPNQNGANLAGNIQLKFGSFGASLFAYAQSGFVINMGSVYRELFDVLLTTDFNDQTDVDKAITRLQGITGLVVDPLTGEILPESLPALYSVSFADLVGTAGFGFTPAEGLDLGVGLKILNRRFSFDRVAVEDAGTDFLSGLETGTTGFTLDAGALYEASPKVHLAVSLQNIIPFKTLESSYAYDYSRATVEKKRDSSGNVITNPSGDTSLVATFQRVFVTGPAKLDLPFLANAGVMYHALDDLDFAFEIADIAAQQEKRYRRYIDRFRLGAEYRLTIIPGTFTIPVRMGLAEMIPTFGAGLHFGNVVQLEFAYFTSNFRKVRTLGAQLRIGW